MGTVITSNQRHNVRVVLVAIQQEKGCLESPQQRCCRTSQRPSSQWVPRTLVWMWSHCCPLRPGLKVILAL